MEALKKKTTPIRARVSSAWTKLETATNKPETCVLSRKEFNGSIR